MDQKQKWMPKGSDNPFRTGTELDSSSLPFKVMLSEIIFDNQNHQIFTTMSNTFFQMLLVNFMSTPKKNYSSI